MKKETRLLIERAIQIQQELENSKPLYKELDDITMQLAESGEQVFEHPKFNVELVDNFKEKNTCFKVAGVKRFDLKVKPRV